MILYDDIMAWVPCCIALAFTAFFYIGFRIVSEKLIRFILDKLPVDADASIASAVYRPGRLAILAFCLYTALAASPWGALASTSIARNLLSSVMITVFYWVVYNLSRSTNFFFNYFISKKGRKVDPAISGILSSFFHLLIIFFLVASVLSTWGFNISGFIAGLSIGGLAVSLAAKDSLANFFACLVILMDQPFHIGDWIICNDVEGIVESISFRSTNVRTFGKALVYIPNSLIINTPIQNFTNRDRRRINMTLGVTYDSTVEQMQALVEKITNYLKNDPDIFQDDMTVVFSEMAASSLNITIICYSRLTSYNDFMKVQERLNLELMKLMDETGTSAAFPSTSIYVEKLPKQETANS